MSGPRPKAREIGKLGGRPKGSVNKLTADIRELAKQYAPAALKELARLAVEAESESARVSACNSVIDRAYGRAMQPTELTGKDKGPIETYEISNQDRARGLISLLASIREPVTTEAEPVTTEAGLLQRNAHAHGLVDGKPRGH